MPGSYAARLFTSHTGTKGLVPFADEPVADDAVQDEGVALGELLGCLAAGEDCHRSLLLGIAERPVHE
jgi:hypothetical protein